MFANVNVNVNVNRNSNEMFPQKNNLQVKLTLAPATTDGPPIQT